MFSFDPGQIKSPRLCTLPIAKTASLPERRSQKVRLMALSLRRAPFWLPGHKVCRQDLGQCRSGSVRTDLPYLLGPSPEALAGYLLGHLPAVLHEAVMCLLLACPDLGDLSDEAARLEACSVESEVGYDWGDLLFGSAEASLLSWRSLGS